MAVSPYVKAYGTSSMDNTFVNTATVPTTILCGRGEGDCKVKGVLWKCEHFRFFHHHLFELGTLNHHGANKYSTQNVICLSMQNAAPCNSSEVVECSLECYSVFGAFLPSFKYHMHSSTCDINSLGDKWMLTMTDEKR